MKSNEHPFHKMPPTWLEKEYSLDKRIIDRQLWLYIIQEEKSKFSAELFLLCKPDWVVQVETGSRCFLQSCMKQYCVKRWKVQTLHKGWWLWWGVLTGQSLHFAQLFHKLAAASSHTEKVLQQAVPDSQGST